MIDFLVEEKKGFRFIRDLSNGTFMKSVHCKILQVSVTGRPLALFQLSPCSRVLLASLISLTS